jgi:hypothetical protein
LTTDEEENNFHLEKENDPLTFISSGRLFKKKKPKLALLVGRPNSPGFRLGSATSISIGDSIDGRG